MVTKNKLIDFIQDKFQVTPDEILILDTGGTFGSKAYEDIFNPPEFSEMLPHSVIPEVIEYLKEKHGISLKFKIAQCKKLDSKNYTEAKLEELAIRVKEVKAKNVIIVHGTDVIINNAKIFEKLALKHSITANIIFTGSYIPIDNGIEISDGVENLKISLEYLEQRIKEDASNMPNIAVALDGKVYENYKEMKKISLSKEQGNMPYRLVNIN